MQPLLAVERATVINFIKAEGLPPGLSETSKWHYKWSTDMPILNLYFHPVGFDAGHAIGLELSQAWDLKKKWFSLREGGDI